MALIEGEMEELIAASVDKYLDSIGGGFRSIFYWSLENRAGIKRIEIADRPVEFVEYLDKMFPSGAFMIREEIIEMISTDLQITRINGDLAEMIKFAARSR